jgi:hypothetical protein
MRGPMNVKHIYGLRAILRISSHQFRKQLIGLAFNWERHLCHVVRQDLVFFIYIIEVNFMLRCCQRSCRLHITMVCLPTKNDRLAKGSKKMFVIRHEIKP